MAGAVARQVLEQRLGGLGPVEVLAWVSTVGEIKASEQNHESLSRQQVDANVMRCPDAEAASIMELRVREIRGEKDSLGGVVSCIARGLPAGLGDPVFNKLTATLAHGLMSLPAARGVEFGEGFAAAEMKGSEHNDAFVLRDGVVRTETNHSGGLQGGITNGETIFLKVAFKPVATIGLPQQTVTRDGEEVTLEARGRHDACVVPRAVPLVEAMVCIALADALS